MPSRLRKTRKLWGHLSHGHSHIGKHRNHPEGLGNAGGMHHHRINLDKYHPGYFGKVGMRHYHLRRNQSFCPTVNLDKCGYWSVNRHGSKLPRTRLELPPSLMLCDRVTTKFWGKGELPKQLVIMKSKFFSRRAEERR
ncbi:60S ribosomal protein L27a [Cricetulus griseus]|uniref:Large ribosomal subunit protein uL15 n=1 Tax=Cricetulus griseus TaxID=10029 RepID=G3HWQ0_CRIGR|nr:60S ribosomal protein L27a [Cricetulus griseus]